MMVSLTVKFGNIAPIPSFFYLLVLSQLEVLLERKNWKWSNEDFLNPIHQSFPWLQKILETNEKGTAE